MLAVIFGAGGPGPDLCPGPHHRHLAGWPSCSFHTSPKLSLKASSRLPPPPGSSSSTTEGSTKYAANGSLIPGSWHGAQGRRAGRLWDSWVWFGFAICFHVTFLPCGTVSSQPPPLLSCVTGSKQHHFSDPPCRAWSAVQWGRAHLCTGLCLSPLGLL